MRVRIVVYGREPVPGKVKTRLARTVGEHSAAAVYRELLEHALAQALTTGLPVTLALAEPAKGMWTPPPGVELELQIPGNLGERMAATFARRFAEGDDVVVLVGSDVPGLGADHLRRAIAAASEAPVVLGPAQDGGYWLVAQRAPGADLYSGVPWSSPDTLAATRTLLATLGVAHRELDILPDIDTVEDLTRAAADDSVALCLRTRLAAWAATAAAEGEARGC